MATTKYQRWYRKRGKRSIREVVIGTAMAVGLMGLWNIAIGSIFWFILFGCAFIPEILSERK